MKRVVTPVFSLGLGVAVVLCASIPNQHVRAYQPAPVRQVASAPWVSLQNTDGQQLMGFAAQTTPFKPGIPSRVREERLVRASDGRTITGFAYYGWTAGASVRVIVLARVPAGQAKRTSFQGDPDSPGTRFEEVAQFTLAVGESRRVDELKGFGGEPIIVKVLSRP